MSESEFWKKSSIENGFQTVEIKSWKDFSGFIMSVDKNEPICWRGQKCDEKEWPLESAFDRIIKGQNRNRDKILKKHCNTTAYAFRGRIHNPSIREIKKEIKAKSLNINHLWAICRHHGLATPLLDWTKSPFVAAYFAFAEPEGKSQIEHRFIYALKYKMAYKINLNPPPNFEWFDPLSSEFPRLLNQDGMFTIMDDGRCIKLFIEEQSKGYNDDWVLMKIKISNKNRKEFLRHLNLMNINHLTLFPDPYGASEFCNINLEIGLL